MKTLLITIAFISAFPANSLSQDSQPTLIPVKCRGGALMSKPDWQSDVLLKIPPNQTVFVFNNFYENDYYRARYEGQDGYITWHVIVPNEKVTAFTDSITTVIVKREARRKILDRVQQDEEAREKDKKWREYVLKKYGSIKGNRILNNEYWIGMTSTEAIESLGKPDRVNRTTGVYGQHEQWVYKGAYLYFEDGKLKSFQESN